MAGALAARFPGTNALPRAGIARLPTPVQLIPATGLALGRLSIKRDDLTSPAYGGNKVRKLDFFLGQALAQGRRAVITFGAYGSNHALATAVHARAVGLDPYAILTPQGPTAYARATILAHAGLGTGLVPIEGWDGDEAAERLVRERAARDGVEPLVIVMGGSSALGAVGFVDAALEVLDAGRPDLVYVAGGTLGTAVGLALGFAAAGARTRVVAPRVTPATVANDAVAAGLTADTVSLLRKLDPGFPDLTLADLRFELRQEFFGPGYAVATPGSESAVAAALDLSGLKLETTYTGRAFEALLADAKAGRLDGADVLFWDTYNSAPLPAAGPVEALPSVLREFVRECEGLTGGAGADGRHDR